MVWKNNEPGAIGIVFKNFNKTIGYDLQNKPFNKPITSFVVKTVFHNVGLACIFEYNKNIRFGAQELFPYWMCDSPWYNPAIGSQLHGYSF